MKMSEEGIKKIRAAFIFEVIGRPPEHLTETLNDLIKRIGEEKGIEIVDKKVNEPVLMKDQKDFYTSFAEVEIEVEDVMSIAMLMFKYMPAHIEVISPENISVTNNGLGEVLSEIARRLHGYDEVARVLATEKNILEKKLKELVPKEVKEEKK